MRYSILIRIDSAGRCPVLVREGDELLTSPGVRWKPVAAADNYDEAAWLMEVAHRQCAERSRDASATAAGAASWAATSPASRSR
jgi:hypothetical protein